MDCRGNCFMRAKSRSRVSIFSVIGSSILFGLHTIPLSAQIQLDLPAQSLSQALMNLGTIANVNVYFDPRLVDGRKAPSVKADLGIDDAFARLLSGTKLHALRVNRNTFRIVPD